jgi:hypothetical protein
MAGKPAFRIMMRHEALILRQFAFADAGIGSNSTRSA